MNTHDIECSILCAHLPPVVFKVILCKLTNSDSFYKSCALFCRYTNYCTVWVNIRDINDNAPVFTHDRYVGLVGEQSNLTTYITKVLATDEDSGDNGEVEYRLQVTEDNPVFSCHNVGTSLDIRVL